MKISGERLYQAILRFSAMAVVATRKRKNKDPEFTAVRTFGHFLVEAQAKEGEKLEYIERETGYSFTALAKKIFNCLDSRDSRELEVLARDLETACKIQWDFCRRVGEQLAAERDKIERNL